MAYFFNVSQMRSLGMHTQRAYVCARTQIETLELFAIRIKTQIPNLGLYEAACQAVRMPSPRLSQTRLPPFFIHTALLPHLPVLHALPYHASLNKNRMKLGV